MRRGRRKSQADASRAEFTARRNRAGDTVVAVCSSPPVSAVANDCVVAAGDEAGAGSSVANVTIGASSGGSGVPQARCGMAGSLAEGAEENDGFALLDVTTDVSLGSRSAPPLPLSMTPGRPYRATSCMTCFPTWLRKWQPVLIT